MPLSLHDICLLSPTPGELSGFYAAALRMSRESLGGSWFLCSGPERRVLIGPGARGSLGFAAYAAHDPEALDALRCRVDAAQCRVELPQTHRLDGNPFAVRDSEGNTLVFGLCPDGTEGPTTEALRARLQHVVFASTNAQRSAVFYSEVLGFTVSDRVLDDTGVLRACFLRTDSEHHSLAVFQATRSGLDHHCYESRDWGLIRDWADHLASLRIPLKWGPGRHGPGNNLFIFIEDPDGNWIEISAELESVAANRPPGTWRHEERTLNAWGAAYLRSE